MKSIIFGGEMVRAILEGRKTQTRRVINLSKLVCLEPDDPRDTENVLMACPYGKPGDRLWVREAFSVGYSYPKGRENGEKKYHYYYKATEEMRKVADVTVCSKLDKYETMADLHVWKSPIHMPRTASRITLEVVGVRVERVQDITGRDAWAEGVIEKFDSRYSDVTTIHRFRTLWDKINGKKYPWASNPWVWVIEFKQI